MTFMKNQYSIFDIGSYNKTGPSTVAWYNGSGVDSKYCCGSIIVNQTETTCGALSNGQHQDSFAIDDGTYVANVAALSRLRAQSTCDSAGLTNKTNTSDIISPISIPTATATVTKSSQCPGQYSTKVVAVCTGVGIPLGIIALVSIVWALWERKRELLVTQPVQPFMQDSPNSNPSELDGNKIGELEGSLPKPAELGCSATCGR